MTHPRLIPIRIRRAPGSRPAPNPTWDNRQLNPEEVARRRHLDCVSYDACLDVACTSTVRLPKARSETPWPGWCCLHCQAYERAPIADVSLTHAGERVYAVAARLAGRGEA